MAFAQAVARPAAPYGLARLSEDLQALAERVRPSIVQVLVTGQALVGEGGATGSQRAGGSGVLLHSDGYVVTNAHVIAGARHIEVLVPPPAGPPGGGRSVLKASGRTLRAEVVGIDRETDLAVLLLPEKGLPVLSLGDSEAVRPGQIVFAFGSPLGLEGSVSLGVVSAVARQLKPESPMIYLQTDASINPGNSGGPLLDTEGRVVGINTLIFSQSGGNEGIGFAAPSNIVRNVFEQIRQKGRVQRGEIGARAQTITADLASGLGLPQPWGVVIADVAPDGPAAEAGLYIGDLVHSMDGKPMENARQFDVNLYRRSVGDVVPLEVQRGEARLTLRVKVRERPTDPDRLAEMVTRERNFVAPLGILALDLSDPRLAALVGSLRAQAGVVVASARGDGLPWEDTLQAGDVIYTLNGQSVLDIEGLRAALGRLERKALGGPAGRTRRSPALHRRAAGIIPTSGRHSGGVVMTTKTRRWILRANACYLLLASTGGMAADLAGAFLSRGPQERILAGAPYTAIGFVEAHGLAFILGVLLWRAAPMRSWHLTAAAVHVLLGTANVVFWQIFIAADMLAAGYVTTGLHWLFVALQLRAATATDAEERNATLATA